LCDGILFYSIFRLTRFLFLFWINSWCPYDRTSESANLWKKGLRPKQPFNHTTVSSRRNSKVRKKFIYVCFKDTILSTLKMLCADKLTGSD
jgi:hypothetical protein